MECSNWMNFEAIRSTIKEHQDKYGNPKEPPFYDLSDFNLTRNCIICDFGGSGSPVIDQLARLLDESGAKIQEEVKRLSGKPLKRVCFKEAKK